MKAPNRKSALRPSGTFRICTQKVNSGLCIIDHRKKARFPALAVFDACDRETALQAPQDRLYLLVPFVVKSKRASVCKYDKRAWRLMLVWQIQIKRLRRRTIRIGKIEKRSGHILSFPLAAFVDSCVPAFGRHVMRLDLLGISGRGFADPP